MHGPTANSERKAVSAELRRITVTADISDLNIGKGKVVPVLYLSTAPLRRIG
jgi:hypothetical protein